MAERQHYSDKGGHKERSMVNKLLKQGIIDCKGERIFYMKRFAKRMPADGKK